VGVGHGPSSFGNIANDLLVGNFKSGFINVYNPATGQFLGQLTDAEGERIHMDGLWALQVGNGGLGGDPTSCTSPPGCSTRRTACRLADPGSARHAQAPAEAQAVVAALDVVQLDFTKLISDLNSGADPSTIAQDRQTRMIDFVGLELAEQQFAQDSRHDQARLPCRRRAAAMPRPRRHRPPFAADLELR